MRLALLVRALLLLQSPPAPEDAILWLGSGGSPALDEQALLDAVAVYTRDLRLSVRALPGTPAPRAPEDAALVAAMLRSRGARLGFWCELRGDPSAVVLTTLDRRGELETHLIPDARAAGPELYRAIALKLRAVLGGTAGVEAQTIPTTPPVTAPPPTAPKPPAPAAGTSPTAALAASRAAERPTGPRRLSFALGYHLSAPLDGAPLRHGVAGEAALGFGRRAEATLAAELAPRTDAGAATGAISVFELPVALGARLVRRRPGLTLGVGGYAALHLLWASASATGGSDAQSFAAAGGVGAELLARTPLGAGLAGELRLSAEAALPTTRYWVRDTPVLEVGARLGLALGLAFPAP